MGIDAAEAAQLFNVTFVTDDVTRMAQFWSSALGYPVVEARDDLARLAAPGDDAPDLLVLHSPHPPRARVHLDLAVADVPASLHRLVDLGAALVDGGSVDAPVWRTGNGISWVVLRDPDGNELCLGGRPVADPAPPSPVPGVVLRPATAQDAPELLVLQRCCWVDEAIANDTVDIAALHESLDDLRDWLAAWSTWCARRDGRLVGAVRARSAGAAWEIGRLMVAPDVAGQGLGRWLLGIAESAAPPEVTTIELFTGARSVRNIRMYERAGYRPRPGPAPPGAVALSKRRAPAAGTGPTPSTAPSPR